MCVTELSHSQRHAKCTSLYPELFLVAVFQGVDSITWIGLLGFRSKLVAPEDQGM